jgi:CBS domain-containing protein
MPKVRDIMTSDVETASPDTTLEEIASMMKTQDVGSIPVVEDEELVGIITDRDIVVRCIAEGKDATETTAEDVLSEDLETASPDMDVDEAAQLMSRRQIRRLPVVEDNRLVGMLSLGDISVKGDEDEAGNALEDISEGVKSSGRKQPQGVDRNAERGGARRAVQQVRSSPRNQTSTARGRQSGSARGRDESESAGTSRQGITSRSASAENSRQERVNPSRSSGKSGSRRRAS